MYRSLRILLQLAGLLLTGASLWAADNTIAVIAVSDITAEGQGTRRGTAANPVFYSEHTSGFSAAGDSIAGVTSPPKSNVEIMLVKALASQGYIYHKLANKPPTIMLVFAWGYLAPQVSSDGRVVQNQADLNALVEGIHAIDSREPGLRAEQIRGAVSVPRFFLTITALDFNALSQKKYVTLWCTRISTGIEGTQLAQVLPALIQAAAPIIGTQTEGPQIAVEPVAAGY